MLNKNDFSSGSAKDAISNIAKGLVNILYDKVDTGLREYLSNLNESEVENKGWDKTVYNIVKGVLVKIDKSNSDSSDNLPALANFELIKKLSSLKPEYLNHLKNFYNELQREQEVQSSAKGISRPAIVTPSLATIIVTDDNIKEIIDSIVSNDPKVVTIDVSGITLNESLLTTLHQAINQNSMLGNIIWGDINQVEKALIESIEAKLLSNNQNFRYYPSHYTLGLLSLHSYQDGHEGEAVRLEGYEKHLLGWKVHKISFDKESGYYGVSYYNEEKCQMVLAHRGIDMKVRKLLKKNCALQAHLEGVLGGAIVTQQALAYEATEETLRWAHEKGYNLSVTGHSLGAWLAELSAYFCYCDFDYKQIKAVTFDSPGSLPVMEKFKSSIENHASKVNLKNINIVTYLSVPNPINSCNPHVGRVYRVFPNLELPKWMEKLKDKVSNSPIIGKKVEKQINKLHMILGHSLDAMLEQFNPVLGKPESYQEVLNWPCIEYHKQTDFVKDGIEGTIGAAVNLIPYSQHVPSFLKGAVSSAGGSLIYKLISGSTAVSLIDVIADLVKGNIDQSKHWGFFENADLKNKLDIKEGISSQERFNLTYRYNYKSEEASPYFDLLKPKGENLDWLIMELKRQVNLLANSKEINPFLRGQISHLVRSYDLEARHDRIYIKTQASITVEDLKQSIKRILEAAPQIKGKLSNLKELSPRHRISQIKEVDHQLIEQIVQDRIDKIMATNTSQTATQASKEGELTRLIDHEFEKLDYKKRIDLKESREDITIIKLQLHEFLYQSVSNIEIDIIDRIKIILIGQYITLEGKVRLENYLRAQKEYYLKKWDKELGLSTPSAFKVMEQSQAMKEALQEVEINREINRKVIKILSKEVLGMIDSVYGQPTSSKYASLTKQEKEWVDEKRAYAELYSDTLPEYNEIEKVLKELTEVNYRLQQIRNQQLKESKSIFGQQTDGVYKLIGKRAGDEGIQRLIKALTTERSNIRVLELANNGISEVGSISVADIVSKSPSLEKLAIENNSIGDKGVAAIALRAKDHPSLRELYLSSCSIGYKGIESLNMVIKSKAPIKKLDLHGNNIEDKGAITLAKGLKGNKGINYIDINEAGITDIGFKALAPTLVSRQYLDLGYNQLTSNAIGCLLEAAKDQEIQVKELKLGGNKINKIQERSKLGSLIYGKQKGGAEALSDFITRAKKITNIDLNNNEIGDEGIIAITQALRSCRYLNMLRLNGNMITERGGEHILELIKHSPLLTTVTIQDNAISKELEKQIAEALQKNMIRSEVLHSAAVITQAASSLSQALRYPIQKLKDDCLIPSSNFFSYLPIEVITNILSFIPEAKVLHINTIATFLESLRDSRVIINSQRDKLLETPVQQNFTKRIELERFSKGSSIEM